MSNYNDDAIAAKKKLDSISKSMCLAKWLQTSLYLTTGHTNSCYHPSPHKMDLSRENLNETPEKDVQKRQMISGSRPSGCDYCWKMEDQGHMSDRHYRSGEPWAMNKFNDVIESYKTGKIINPTYVEVNFNYACNLKCSYCSPQYSSTWMAESKHHGAWPTITPHNDPSYFAGDRKPIPNREHNPYLEKFWEWWPDLYKDLKHFRMTGGEPLMDPNTYKVFEYVLDNPKSDLHLNTTSNFSVEPDIFKKYIRYLKQICNVNADNVEHFMQFVSIDAWAEKAEYIRHGLNFDRFCGYVHEYMNEVPSKNSITFIITLNNLSITSVDQLLKMILDLRKQYSKTYQKIWFDVPLLTYPKWQSIQILPESYAYKLEKVIEFMEDNPENNFEGFKDYEIAKFKRNLDHMKMNLPNNVLNESKINFYRFFNEHDKRRNTDFLKTFPEMVEFWDECMYRSNECFRVK